jgi:hypothetical protein
VSTEVFPRRMMDEIVEARITVAKYVPYVKVRLKLDLLLLEIEDFIYVDDSFIGGSMEYSKLKIGLYFYSNCPAPA